MSGTYYFTKIASRDACAPVIFQNCQYFESQKASCCLKTIQPRNVGIQQDLSMVDKKGI